jgi:hypothetical protein
MKELNAVSTLALFETDKKQRAEFSKNIVSAIEEGKINVLDAHLQLKSMQEVADNILITDEKKNKNPEIAKRYKELLMSEADLHGKSFERHQAKFSISEVGTVYDFSACEDPIIDELFVTEKDLKVKIDNRKAELKTAPPEGRTEINPNTGEVMTVYPPKKTSTTSLKVTLK